MSITSALKPKRKRGNQPGVIARVRARDRHCQWRGCRVVDNTEVHHIIEKADGGTDDMHNLILYCKEHHLMSHGRIKWDSLVYTGITRTMSIRETKEQMIKNNSRSKFIGALKSMAAEQIRKQVYRKLFETTNKNQPTVNVAQSRIAEILSNMDSKKAADILRHL